MAFDKTTSGKLIEMVHDYIDLSANQRRYLIGPKLVSAVGKKPEPSDPTPEEGGEEEGGELDTTDSFFMKLDESVSDQEESRTRRLEF